MMLVGVVLYRLSVPDALTLTGVVIGAGIPSLGFLWLRHYAERQTLAAFAVAIAWMVLTAIPGIAIGTVLGLLVQAALGG
jgi:predicted membrane channel-forming protein YqfA (hemolysin III family)